MKPLLIASTLIAFTTTVQAIEPADVAKCWNIMPQDIGIGAEVEMVVGLNADGTVGTTEVTRYSPDTEQGYGIARSALRAVMACGPYAGATAGNQTIVFKVDERPAPDGIPLPGTQ